MSRRAADSGTELSGRDLALRKAGKGRLQALRKRSDRVRKHLESDRGKADLQALHYLLHEIEVEYNDLRRNLEDPEYVPKLGKKPKPDRTKSVPLPGLPTDRQPGPGFSPSRFAIQRPVLREDLQDMGQREGRSWCSAALVEALVPPQHQQAVLRHLEKFAIEDEGRIVREWAEKTFGSLESARDALIEGARVGNDPVVWREWIDKLERSELAQGLDDAALLADAKVERAVACAHRNHWVQQLLERIKKFAKGRAHLDSFDRQVRAHLKSFHRAVNSGKHTNPQFSYLTLEKPVVSPEAVVESVLEWLDLDESERYARDSEDDRKRHKLTLLQKELGAAKRAVAPSGAERRQRWGGRAVMRGMVTRTREGCVCWDNGQATNGLVLVLPVAGGERLESGRFVHVDGRPLIDDLGRRKSCLVLPLALKHDFLRWYAKHVDNHRADAKLHRRCQQKSMQFVVVEPKSEKSKLFIRPIFKFYDELVEVPSTHEFFKKPQCRYLVGVDLGVNYVLRAVVYDSESESIVHDFALRGRKQEWAALRERLAYHQQRRAFLRSRNKPRRDQIRRENDAIRGLRKKDRGLGRTEAIEAVASLIERLEAECGRGQYCIVMEDLDFGSMNLKRNNRVKHMAAVRDAFVNQLRKRGYRYNERSGRVDGLRFEAQHYTSQVSPGGWWAKRDEVKAEHKRDRKRPIGRKVGAWYESRDDDSPCRRGRYRKVEGKGRPVFYVDAADLELGAPRRLHFGTELFWDPKLTTWKEHSFPEGVVFDADFVGALNLALRPVVKDGRTKGFGLKDAADEHTRLNPKVKVACKVALYRFEETNGDPRGALRRVVL